MGRPLRVSSFPPARRRRIARRAAHALAPHRVAAILQSCASPERATVATVLAGAAPIVDASLFRALASYPGAAVPLALNVGLPTAVVLSALEEALAPQDMALPGSILNAAPCWLECALHVASGRHCLVWGTPLGASLARVVQTPLHPARLLAMHALCVTADLPDAVRVALVLACADDGVAVGIPTALALPPSSVGGLLGALTARGPEGAALAAALLPRLSPAQRHALTTADLAPCLSNALGELRLAALRLLGQVDGAMTDRVDELRLPPASDVP